MLETPSGELIAGCGAMVSTSSPSSPDIMPAMRRKAFLAAFLEDNLSGKVLFALFFLSSFYFIIFY